MSVCHVWLACIMTRFHQIHGGPLRLCPLALISQSNLAIHKQQASTPEGCASSHANTIMHMQGVPDPHGGPHICTASLSCIYIRRCGSCMHFSDAGRLSRTRYHRPCHSSRLLPAWPACTSGRECVGSVTAYGSGLCGCRWVVRKALACR